MPKYKRPVDGDAAEYRITKAVIYGGSVYLRVEEKNGAGTKTYKTINYSSAHNHSDEIKSWY